MPSNTYTGCFLSFHVDMFGDSVPATFRAHQIAQSWSKHSICSFYFFVLFCSLYWNNCSHPVSGTLSCQKRNTYWNNSWVDWSRFINRLLCCDVWIGFKSMISNKAKYKKHWFKIKYLKYFNNYLLLYELGRFLLW